MHTTNATTEERTATDRDDHDHNPSPVPEQVRGGHGLTAFQRNILLVLLDHDGSEYGLAIKRALETPTFYDETINHGRLYPNLDTLIEHGLVEKSELDKRTNEYALTEQGRGVLSTMLDRLMLAARVPRDDADQILDHVDATAGGGD